MERALNGVLLIKPRIFSDDRGYFYESWSKDAFLKEGINLEFVQDNQSLSCKGTLRGLHFQNPPFAQGKLVRVIQGAVLDVAVDIRKSSPTYGEHFSAVLSGENHLQMWIPPGFAHGFLALEEGTVFAYKCTNGYNKASEGSLRWNDPTLKISWGIESPLISDKDAVAPLFEGFNSEFQ